MFVDILGGPDLFLGKRCERLEWEILPVKAYP